MKKFFEKMKKSGLWMFAVMLLCALFGIGGADAAYAAEAGTITYGEPVSLDYALEHAPEVVKDTIDREVVVIKPHLTPLYTLGAKHAKKSKTAGSPIIKYDEVEMLPMTTTVATAFITAGQTQAAIDLENNDLIAVNETLVFKNVDGYKENGTDPDGWFVGYVKDTDTSGKPIIVPVNGKESGSVTNSIPELPAGTIVVRGARTGSEKQSRTAPLAVVPVQKEQYMQKMLIETEETTFFVLAQDNADVKWRKTEITDFAIAEHKMSTETDILLGKKRVVKIPNKYNQNKPDATYFQEGVWWQAGRDFDLPRNATRADLISMMKTIFTGNYSSNTKIMFVGSDVNETINKIDYNQVIYPGKPGQVFGLDVQRIIYGQYTLVLVNEPAFDDSLMSDHALVIDEDYLYKYQHGWRSIPLDNLKLGQSDSQSQVFIDTFGYVLKNAKAHCRIKLA